MKDNTCVRGNISLKNRDSHYEIKVSDVIKKMDSANHLEECIQNKCEVKWKCIDLMACNDFSNTTFSKIKCADGLNMCENRMQISDKCPVCNQDETWEHVILCDK